MIEQKLNKATPDIKVVNEKTIYTQEEVAKICEARLKLLKESSNNFIDNSLDFRKNLRKE
jgi:hypothetical protein